MPPLRRSAIALPRPAKALGNALSIAPSSALIQYGILGLKVVAGALAGATVALAFMNYESRQPGAPAFEPARNETVVYRRATPPKSYARMEQADEVAVEPADPAEPVLTSHTSYYERPVQTVSFTNSNVDQPRSIFEVTRAAIAKALVKVGGFVAYRSTTETAEPEIAPRKRTGGIMDEVDDYLWEVYQRLPVKKDGTGDFTWKDPAAARRMGLALQDYVISGMNPEFREQLYHAGKAMDAAGLQWSMLSAFRDDYRQRLAAGFKASVGNSLHGGSRRTGGYGDGRAIDIAGADETQMEDVWKWIDAHGAKYGLSRPMPGADPAHIQQRGDANKVAMHLREVRTGIADARVTETRVAETRVSSDPPSWRRKHHRTKVASAR